MDFRERDAFIAYSKLPVFQRKVEKAKAIIREALAIGPAYVAVSWGKDSVALLHLCQQVQPDILAAHHCHEERDFISNYSEVERAYCERFPHTNLKIVPTNDADGNIAKGLNLARNYPVAFVGLRSEESKKRAISLKKYGLIHRYANTPNYRACPVGWWTWQDIWAYIVGFDLPWLKAYDEDIRGRDLSRTTSHVSKSTYRKMQQERLAAWKITNPDYYEYLRFNFPSMFQ